MSLQSNSQRLIFQAVQVSLFGNIILFVIKVSALILVRSMAIATDLGITVAGLVVSVILYYSLKLANKPADLLHNYGYGKIEFVCEALEGIVLIGIGLVMSIQAISHLFHPSEMTAPWLGFGFSIVSSSINFIGAKWILSLGNRCQSPAVHAEGLHYKLEGFISLTVAIAFLIGVILSMTQLKAWSAYLDPAATLAVSFSIAIPSFRLAKHAFEKLLDASIDEKGKIEVIKQLSKYIDQCCEFRDIRSRTSGRANFVELKLVLPPHLTFQEAYTVAAALEQDLHDNIPECLATVTIYPCKEQCLSHKTPASPALALS